MTAWDQVDQMARGGSIALLAQWSWILIRDHWRDVPARLAVAMNVGICSYLIITAGIFGKPSLIGLLFALGAGATPGLFWLFAKAWFNDEKRVAPISALLVGLSVANTLVVQLTYPHGGTANAISAVLFRASMLAFAGAALWEVWRSREGDLVERRRRIRPVLVCVVAICVISIAFVEVAASPGTPAASWRLAVATGSLLAVFSFCAVLLRMRQGDMFGPVESTGVTAKTPRNLGEDPLAARLLQFMAAQMPYRDETMSIAKLAALLGEQEYRLRRTINGQLGHRNFSSFLNSYRLSESDSKLSRWISGSCDAACEELD